MLHLLYAYAQEHGLDVGPGFAPEHVHWAISCSRDGRYHHVMRLGDTSDNPRAGRVFPKCPEMSHGQKTAGGETKSPFLVASTDVVTLYGRKVSEKVRKKHEYFVSLLEQAAEADSDLAAAAACLRDPGQLEAIRRDLEAGNAKPAEKITFHIGDTFPLLSNTWHHWWRTYLVSLDGQKKGGKPKATSRRVRCFVTGDLAEPALTHPPIEGLGDVGGNKLAGSPLVSFNEDAYCSYRLKQSANAAISDVAATGYRAALNDLIGGHSQTLAGAKFVHWFERAVEDSESPISWMTTARDAQEADAQHLASKLLMAIRTGKRPDLARNRYYALTLSGTDGRVMVRDWMEGQFEELVQNIESWFGDLAIAALDGNLVPSPRFLDVLKSTVRQPTKQVQSDKKQTELAAPFVAQMWRVAVHGEPVPPAALAAVVGRWRADRFTEKTPNRWAAGLMKAYHVRMARAKEGTGVVQQLTPYINEAHPDAAYHCGRLMAVLASLQRKALPTVQSGIVQRYYAAASSTPALVLGRLTRTSQYHLDKLSPGLAHWFEQRLGAIWSRIGSWVPVTLSLEQQSLFALGYYQELVDLRSKHGTGDEEEENHE